MSSCDDCQRDVIDFLSKPESYDLAAGAVERYETHGAIVFLAGDHAYKLKRAVRYPYMDYSTVERRRLMCERELSVNRRTAPDLYLEVRPILRDAGNKLCFGPVEDATVIDWVVVMRRFEQDDLLERMCQQERLVPASMRPLAEAIASFHGAAEICHDFGGADGIAAVIEENTAVVESLVDRPFDSQKIERYSRLSKVTFGRLRGILEKRRADGFVRRCHGDLHLNNICLIGGRPVLFDAIEFSEAFACIDVFYDLAFLVMDLDRHGLRGHTNVLLNRYLEMTRDYDGLAALPLFLSLRAAIRAHVAATAAGIVQPHDPSQTKFGEAVSLFDQAIAYLEPLPARLVAIGGVSGTGKSTLARNIAAALGPSPGAVVIRSDVIRKQLMSVNEMERLPDAAYRPEVTIKVYSKLNDLSARILAAGHGAIVDAVYGDPRERAEIEAVAAAQGVRFDGFWLEAEPALLADRITARHGDASDATIDVLRRQLGFVHRPDNWTQVDAAPTPVAVAEYVCRGLGVQGPKLGTTAPKQESTAPETA
jgi:hypothetical protein